MMNKGDELISLLIVASKIKLLNYVMTKSIK
jgi:hypothetical protein